MLRIEVATMAVGAEHPYIHCDKFIRIGNYTQYTYRNFRRDEKSRMNFIRELFAANGFDIRKLEYRPEDYGGCPQRNYDKHGDYGRDELIRVAVQQTPLAVAFEPGLTPAKQSIKTYTTTPRKYAYGKYLKARNKMISDFLGCSAPIFFDIVCKLQWKLFVVPVYHHYKVLKPWQVAKNPSVNRSLLRSCWHALPLLEEAVSDKLTHLTPLIAAFGKNPKELSAIFKGKWKMFTKNTIGRNKLIIRCFENPRSSFVTNRQSNDAYVASLIKCLDIPSTLLRTFPGITGDAMSYLKTNFKGKWGKKSVMDSELCLFNDTARMATQLGTTINPKWSARRVKEEHDKYVGLINAKRYPADVFTHTSILPKEIEKDGFKATLLDSALLLHNEGARMGHCVASYIPRVKNGDYAVYSISTPTQPNHSTLGISINKREFQINTPKGFNNFEAFDFKFNQHYGSRNSVVTDKDEVTFARDFVVSYLQANVTSVEKGITSMSQPHSGTTAANSIFQACII